MGSSSVRQLAFGAGCFLSAFSMAAPSEQVLASHESSFSGDYFALDWQISVSPNGFAIVPANLGILEDANDLGGWWIGLPASSTALYKPGRVLPTMRYRSLWNINSFGIMFDSYNFWDYDESTPAHTFGQIGVRPIQGLCPSDRCWQADSVESINNWIWWLADNGEAVALMQGFADEIDPAEQILLHRLNDGTIRRIAQYTKGGFSSPGYPFDAPRINSKGDIVVSTGYSVVSYTWNGTSYDASTLISRGESYVDFIDPANFFLAEDGTVAFLGLWNNDPLHSNGVSALFAKQPGGTLQYFFPPADSLYSPALGVQSAPFSAPGEPKKLRWALSGKTQIPYGPIVTHIWAGLDLMNDGAGTSSWSEFEIQRATPIDFSISPPSVGVEGECMTWNGVDSLGRVCFLRAEDNRDSFDPVMGTVSRNLQFVRTMLERVCPADFNDDGQVDDADFAIFITEYDKLLIPPAHPICDLNFDGQVGDSDFTIFTAAYDEYFCP